MREYYGLKLLTCSTSQQWSSKYFIVEHVRNEAHKLFSCLTSQEWSSEVILLLNKVSN